MKNWNHLQLQQNHIFHFVLMSSFVKEIEGNFLNFVLWSFMSTPRILKSNTVIGCSGMPMGHLQKLLRTLQFKNTVKTYTVFLKTSVRQMNKCKWFLRLSAFCSLKTKFIRKILLEVKFTTFLYLFSAQWLYLFAVFQETFHKATQFSSCYKFYKKKTRWIIKVHITVNSQIWKQM